MVIRLSILILLFLTACGEESGKKVEQIPVDGPVSSIIRHPATASGEIDTTNIPKMTFEETEFDFGSVREKDIVKHTFHFTNTGQAPLLIADARSTCGCTVPQWPKEPIPPGGSGAIEVAFNTTNKAGVQSKPVTILANTFPSETVITLKGVVVTISEN